MVQQTTPCMLACSPGCFVGKAPAAWGQAAGRALTETHLQHDIAPHPRQQARSQLSRTDCAPAVQAAITHNTKPIVDRNMAAGRVQISREPVPHGAVLSPCSQLVAWIMSRGIMVQRCCGRSLIASAPMPAHSQSSSLCWSQSSSHIAVWYSSVGAQYTLVLELASGQAHRMLLSRFELSILPMPMVGLGTRGPPLDSDLHQKDWVHHTAAPVLGHRCRRPARSGVRPGAAQLLAPVVVQRQPGSGVPQPGWPWHPGRRLPPAQGPKHMPSCSHPSRQTCKRGIQHQHWQPSSP